MMAQRTWPARMVIDRAVNVGAEWRHPDAVESGKKGPPFERA